ncbi:hypothetical protein CDAR_214221 [Caerostris darwini]|uniref:Uncharacterized protein n=1 Tax=Caerostris darwini TaxID=1538125 RepID=A0AAV4S235_9ARAC|nr:hypothetical protein CDAR_214221 [Caerostris darwini]
MHLSVYPEQTNKNERQAFIPRHQPLNLILLNPRSGSPPPRYKCPRYRNLEGDLGDGLTVSSHILTTPSGTMAFWSRSTDREVSTLQWYCWQTLPPPPPYRCQIRYKTSAIVCPSNAILLSIPNKPIKTKGEHSSLCHQPHPPESSLRKSSPAIQMSPISKSRRRPWGWVDSFFPYFDDPKWNDGILESLDRLGGLDSAMALLADVPPFPSSLPVPLCLFLKPALSSSHRMHSSVYPEQTNKNERQAFIPRHQPLNLILLCLRSGSPPPRYKCPRYRNLEGDAGDGLTVSSHILTTPSGTMAF